MLSPDQLTRLKYAATTGGGPSASTTGLVDDSQYQAWKNGTQQSVMTPAAAPPDTRNVFQKVAGTFVDPIAVTGERFGEAVGAAGLQGANAVSGGALDRFTQHHFGHTLDQGIQSVTDAGSTVPLLGTPIQASNKDTAEEVGGRALSTIALGAKGILAGGALFGAGGAMQQDKDTFGVAADAIGTALAGKILQYGFHATSPYIAKAMEQYGAPVVAKIAHLVPEESRAAFNAFADKIGASVPDVAGAEVLPKPVSSVINKTNDVVGAVADAPFKAAESAVADKFSSEMSPSRAGRLVDNRVKELDKLESGNAVIRKAIANGNSKGIDVKRILANTDLLQGAVDNSGTIRTTHDGGAVDQLNEFIKPQEDVISKTLLREGKTIPVSQLEEELKQAINDSPVKGGAKIRALKTLSQDIAGYKLDAVDAEGNPWVEGKSEGEPHIPLATVHDAKVDKYANIDYSNPESSRTDKVLARALKENVENNTDSVDAKKLNAELAQHYAVLNLLEKLDGKKVAGGRLGKYFAQTVGAVIGGHFGPLGGIVGAEAGGALRGAQMASTFGKGGGTALEQSEAMKEAIAANEEHQSSKSLGKRNTAQSTNTTKENMTGTPEIVAPENAPEAAPVHTEVGPESTPEEIHAAATAYNPEFQANAKKAADAMGLEYKEGPVKTVDRASEKATNEVGDISNVKDWNRGAMLIDSFDNGKQISKAIGAIKENLGDIQRVKFTVGDPTYNKIIVNTISPNGVPGEIQLTTPEMWDTKMKSAEALYAHSRKPETTPQVKDALEHRMDELYTFSPSTSATKKFIKAAADNGGASMDLIRHIDYGGTPHISVAPFPERSVILDKGASMGEILDYVEKNKDLFKNRGTATGMWTDPASGKTYLDAAIMIPKEHADLAEKLGKMGNQIAGFDLQDFKELPYGGDGSKEGVAPLSERTRLVKEILQKHR